MILVGVLQALVIAVALSMVDVVRRSARPRDAVLGYVGSLGRWADVRFNPAARLTPGVVVYRLDDRLFFANASYFKGRIRESVAAAPPPVHSLVFDVAGVPDTDSAAQAALLDLKRGLDTAGIGLVFAMMRETLRVDLDEGQASLDQIGEGNLFETVECCGHGMPAAGWRQPTPGRGRPGDDDPAPDLAAGGLPPTTPGRPTGSRSLSADRLSALRLPRRRVQADRGRRGQVEALRASQDRDPDDVVHGREHRLRQAMGLVAEHPRDPPLRAGPHARR